MSIVVVVVVVAVAAVVAVFIVKIFVVVVPVVVVVQTVGDIFPREPLNMLLRLASEITQETPQSVWSNDIARWNILFMLVTADTCHTDRS